MDTVEWKTTFILVFFFLFCFFTRWICFQVIFSMGKKFWRLFYYYYWKGNQYKLGLSPKDEIWQQLAKEGRFRMPLGREAFFLGEAGWGDRYEKWYFWETQKWFFMVMFCIFAHDFLFLCCKLHAYMYSVDLQSLTIPTDIVKLKLSIKWKQLF